MNNRISLPLIVLTIFTSVLLTTVFADQPTVTDQNDYVFTDSHAAKTEDTPTELPDDSVLNLIPEDVLGIVYCPSLSDLNNKINDGAAEMMPQVGQQPELLAMLLASSFGAGFESLAELEAIGLDLDKDFAVFFTSNDLTTVAATVHLTDPDAIMQVIETEAEGSEPTEYNGETYWSADGEDGNFAILGNTLVFSQLEKDCVNIIDVSKGDKKSIVANDDYTQFLNQILKGTDQVAAYFNLEAIIAPHMESLKKGVTSTLDEIQSDPATMTAVPLMENMWGTYIELIDDLKSVSATIQIHGTDIQLAPFLKFKDGGKIQKAIEEYAPDELAIMNDLPNGAFLFGGFEGNVMELYEWWSTSWLLDLPLEDEEHKQELKQLTLQMQEMYESLGEEQGFSINFRDTFIPDVLVIYNLKDEEKVKKYYDEDLLDSMTKMMQTMKESLGEFQKETAFSDFPLFTIYDGAYAANPIMHNGVEIKTIVFPNFGTAFQDVPAEVAVLLPQEWHWSYAFFDGHLYFALGGPEIIQSALNSKAKVVESLSENAGYQNLVEKLGKDNNLLFGISPITAFNSFVSLTAKADPNAGLDMQMMSMFMGIPENYSIGVSAKVRDGGIGAKLLISLGDYKQLVQTFMMLNTM